MKDPFLINPKKVTESIVEFLKREFKTRKKAKAIIGLSGGIDSAVTTFLCKKAGLDILVALMPYEFSSQKDCITDAKLVIDALKILEKQVVVIDIALAVDAQVRVLVKHSYKIGAKDKGNIKARQRMIVQYYLASVLEGLVVGTENLSEYYLGYFTLHGDQAANINPIGGLFKTQVIQLASWLGVPKGILEKPPTAGLWDGQTDEGELGFSYKEADPILYWAKIEKYPEEKIIKELGFNEELVKKVLSTVKDSYFKREEIPKWNYFKAL